MDNPHRQRLASFEQGIEKSPVAQGQDDSGVGSGEGKHMAVGMTEERQGT